MFPLLASVVLLGAIGAVLWAAWQPIRDDIRENPVINVPLFAITLGLVTIAPLAWAIAHAL